MNNTIALSQLIVRLGKTADTDSATARRFLRAFFGTIEEALAAGEPITIPGIGTFRHSTAIGAEPGKVIFVPDSELAKAINAPFEIFEPVELAGGVDFSNEPEPEPEPAPEASPEPEPQPEPESAPATAPAAAVTYNPAHEAYMPKQEDTVIDEPEQQPVAADEVKTEAEPVYEPYEPATQPAAIVEEEPEQNDDDASHAVEEESKPSRRIWWIGAAIIIIGGTIGFFAASYDPDETPETVPVEEPAPVDTTQIIADVPVEALGGATEPVEQSVADEPVAPAADTHEQPAAQPQTPAKEPLYDTVTANHYLASMARKYYGRSIYWVFIYQANADHLDHPGKIPPGTRVLIPEKSSFAEATENATVAKAQRIANELNNKYK